jgi:hypothetical protein
MISKVFLNPNRVYGTLSNSLKPVDILKHMSNMSLRKLFPLDVNWRPNSGLPPVNTEWSHNLAGLPRILRKFFKESVKKIELTDTHISGYKDQNIKIVSVETLGPIKETFDKLITRDPVLRQVIIPSKYNPGIYNIKYK